MAKTRKLSKKVDYEKGVVEFTVLSTGDILTCDTAKLPPAVAKKLVPLAINHRIGDAAAGRDGAEALASMTKVWEALMSGDFSVRTPASGITKASIVEKLSNLDKKEAAEAAALLKKLGITI